MQTRHEHPSLESRCKRLHHRLLSMHKKCLAHAVDAGVPRQQLPLIGVGGEAVDRMDVRPDRDVFSEEGHGLLPSMIGRASVPLATKPTKIALAFGLARL